MGISLNVLRCINYDKTEYNVVNIYKAILDIHASIIDWSKPIKSQTALNNHDVWSDSNIPKEEDFAISFG